MRPITLALALALSALWPVQIMAQPVDRPLSAFETHLGEGNDHGRRYRWKEAIAAYTEALEDASFECEEHWAYAGISAAYAGLSAEAVLDMARKPHPNHWGILSAVFEQRLQDGWEISRLAVACP